MFFFLVINIKNVNAQSNSPLVISWLKHVGGGTYSAGVAIGSDGSAYTVGGFYGVVNFEGENLTSSENNYFLVKHDKDGNFQWVRSGTGTGNAQAKGVSVGVDGSVYIIGHFSGTVDLGGGNLTASGNDYFLVKYDTNGTFQWVRREVGGTGSAQANGVSVGVDGSVYTAGYFSGTVNLGGGNLTASGNDYFVVKHDKDGNFQWVRREVGGAGSALANGVSVGVDGSVYTAGYFSGTVDLGGGSLTASGNDYFLIKHDTDGNFQWVRREIGIGHAQANGVSVGVDGSIYTTGYFTGSNVNFDGTGGSDLKSSNGGQDVFITKYYSNGSYSWTRTFGGPGNDDVKGISVGKDGSVYTTGEFVGTIDFGGGVIQATGAMNYFAVKYDKNGNFKWARTQKVELYGGAFGAGIALGNDNSLYLTGNVTGYVDFGGGFITFSSAYFTLKFDEKLSREIINFQGKLVNKEEGTNVGSTNLSCIVNGANNDTCKFRVSIYDNNVGGALLWQEEHNNVEIGEYNGVFNLEINSICNNWKTQITPLSGCTNSLSGINWREETQVYLRVELDPDGNGYSEDFGYKKLTGVPFAQYANEAGSLNGYTEEDFIQLQPSSPQEINTATNNAALIWIDQLGTGTPNFIEFQKGGHTRFIIDNEGKIGIGETTPNAYLDIKASTTNNAHINLTAGVDPTSPNNGDLWWNGTELYFNNGTTDIDLLAGGGDSYLTEDIVNNVTYLTDTTMNFSVGGTSIENSSLGIDVENNIYYFGTNETKDPILSFTNTNSTTATLSYTGNDTFNITNDTEDVRLGINKDNAEYELDVNGSIQVSGDILTSTPVTFGRGPEYQWTRTFGGSSVDYGNGIAVGADGSIYTTGYFRGNSIDFDGTGGSDLRSSNGDIDVFITKYNGDGSYGWTRTFGGSSADHGNGIAVGADGSIYTTGYFGGSNVNFDGTGGSDLRSSNGVWDVFITKYNSDGSYGWTRTFGGSGDERGNGIAVGADGSIYTTGYFGGSNVNFDGTGGSDLKSSNGGWDVFITKYNSDGSYGWTRTIGGNSNDVGNGIAVGVDGSVYTTGYFQGSNVNFDDTGGSDLKSSNGIVDVFITKYNSDGSYGWTRTFGGISGDYGNGISVGADGSIYITGQFHGTNVNFDDTGGSDLKSSNGIVGFITKYNSDGSYGWSRIIGGVGNQVVVGTNGSMYATGAFRGIDINFDDTGGSDLKSSNGEYYDAFITKYNGDGSYEWTTTFGGSETDIPSTIAARADGSIYTTGYFTGSNVNFDGTGGSDLKSSNGGPDVFITKYMEKPVGSNIGSDTLPFANIYTYGLVAKGVVELNNVVRVGGDILADQLPVNSIISQPKLNNVKSQASVVSRSRSVIEDSIGNKYVTGQVSGTNNFASDWGGNDTIVGYGSNDIFITKINADGSYGWTRVMGGTGNDTGYGISIDSRNDVYIVGQFAGTVNFGASFGVSDSRVSVGGVDGFILKINSDSSYGWVRTFGGTGEDVAYGIDIDINNNLYITGWFTGNVNFRSNFGGTDNKSSAGSTDGFLLSVSFDGGYRWVRTFGGTGGDATYNTSVDKNSGIVYVVGLFQGTVNFRASFGGTDNKVSLGGNDAFVHSVGTDGTYRWTRRIGGAGADGLYGISVDSNDHVYVAGSFQGTVNLANDFSGVDNKTSLGGVDGFIAKINSNGNYIWGRKFGGAGDDLVEKVLADNYGNVYAIGRFANSVNFRGDFGGTDNKVSAGDSDIFITSVSSEGAYGWSRRIGGSGSELILGSATSFDNQSVYIVGSYSSNVNFGQDFGENIIKNSVASITAFYMELKVGERVLSGGVNIGSESNYFSELYVSRVNTSEINIRNFDVAEEYLVEDESIGAGEIVRFKEKCESENTSSHPQTEEDCLITVERTEGEYDKGAIGVISTKPGLYLKDWEKKRKNGRPVALVGRVPVKVTDENGKIERGDLITTSNKYKGYGMKASEGGYVVGRAMESFGEGDSILVNKYLEEERKEAEKMIRGYEEALERGEATCQNEVERQNLASQTTECIKDLELRIEKLTKEIEKMEMNQDNKIINTGRIMMYVDLGYVGGEYYNQVETQDFASLQTKDLATQNNLNLEDIGRLGRLIKVVEKEGERRMRIEVDRLVLAGVLEVEGEVKIKGRLEVERAEVKELRVGERLEIGESSRMIGSATIAAGEREVFVPLENLTEKSYIFITNMNEIHIKDKKITGQKGILLERHEDISSDEIKIQYILVN